VPATQVIVVYDEIDLEFGTLRIRPQGGAGGHNGMKSLINHLGRTFPRVRLGVGRPPGRMPASAYVLRRFKGDELPVVDTMLDQAAEAVETIIRDGLELAMNRYNGSVLQDD
jgi:PTH1 family peptidyl-tRNA hydrolase